MTVVVVGCQRAGTESLEETVMDDFTQYSRDVSWLRTDVPIAESLEVRRREGLEWSGAAETQFSAQREAVASDGSAFFYFSLGPREFHRETRLGRRRKEAQGCASLVRGVCGYRHSGGDHDECL